MKKEYFYCDICGKDIPYSNSESGRLVKRVSTQVRSESIEVVVVIRGWSKKLDICEECAKEAFSQTKKKLAFTTVGEN
jgi:hypothetical protein